MITVTFFTPSSKDLMAKTKTNYCNYLLRLSLMSVTCRCHGNQVNVWRLRSADGSDVNQFLKQRPFHCPTDKCEIIPTLNSLSRANTQQ